MSGLSLLTGGGGGVALRSDSDSDGAEGTIINTNKHHSGPSAYFQLHLLDFTLHTFTIPAATEMLTQY